GLTPKHVDVPELLRVLDFANGDMRVLKGESLDANLTVYRAPVEEFALSKVDWTPAESDSVPLAADGPQILLCTKGGVLLSVAPGATAEGMAPVELRLNRGDSVWLAASDPAIVARPLTSDCSAQI